MLERLIDEELLVQRGLELGMAQSDGAVRNAIVNSLIASVTAEADAASPTDEELEQHLADNADRFSFVDKVAVEGWQTDDERLRSVLQRICATDGEPVVTDAIRTIPDLPAALMPIEILRDYLGPGYRSCNYRNAYWQQCGICETWTVDRCTCTEKRVSRR